jgi:hypothetical protein
VARLRGDLCTGVIDHYPHFDGWDSTSVAACSGASLRRLRLQRRARRGGRQPHDETASEALQLQRFTDKLTVLTDSQEARSAKFPGAAPARR